MIGRIRVLRPVLGFPPEDWFAHLPYADVTQLLNVTEAADRYLRAMDAAEPVKQNQDDFDVLDVTARLSELRLAEQQLRGALIALSRLK